MAARNIDKKTDTTQTNDDELALAVKMVAAGNRPRKKAKETLGFRCDAELKAMAHSVFGADIGFVLESALRQALKERKKL